MRRPKSYTKNRQKPMQNRNPIPSRSNSLADVPTRSEEWCNLSHNWESAYASHKENTAHPTFAPQISHFILLMLAFVNDGCIQMCL